MAIVAAPALAVLIAGFLRRSLSDDGLIYTRPVRQVLAGNGPVFNVGERAETSTGTLWQWLLVLAGWLTQADLGLLAVGLGLILSATGMALAVDGTRRLHDRPGQCLLPAGVLLPLALPPFWDYATSGLETGLQTLYVGSCWWLLLRCRYGSGRRLLLLAAAVMGAGPLVRPDLGLAAAIFLLTVLGVAPLSWRLRGAALLAAGAAPVAYEVFRSGYYGILVPLPALAKEGSVTNVVRGWAYLRDFLSPYWLVPPVLAVLVLLGVTAVLLRREREWRSTAAHRDLAVLAAPVMCGLLMAAYVVRVGGDYMHARMLLPALLLLLLPVLVVPARRPFALPALVVAAWALLALSPLRQPFDGGNGEIAPGIRTVNVRINDAALTGTPHPLRAADWLSREGSLGWLSATAERARRAPRPVLAHGPVRDFRLYELREGVDAEVVLTSGYLGATGAALRVDEVVADEWGLAYPLAAHMELVTRGLPGHEKLLPQAWLFADYAGPGSELPSEVDPAAVAAARRALGCGELRELQESVRAPLTAQRFWDNLTGALRRTTLRIPPDPFAAERQFCGRHGE